MQHFSCVGQHSYSLIDEHHYLSRVEVVQQNVRGQRCINLGGPEACFPGKFL